MIGTCTSRNASTPMSQTMTVTINAIAKLVDMVLSQGLQPPRVNSSGTGDLHVRVQMWTPERLTEREEELVRELSKVQKSVPVDRGKSFWMRMRDALGA